MEMVSFCLKIRHVFGFTSLTERSIESGPPVIMQLSGRNIAIVDVQLARSILQPFLPSCRPEATIF
jgi:hypothetical protein